MSHDKGQELRGLTTEQTLPETESIDHVSTLEMIGMINRADSRVHSAVALALPQIAAAIDAISAALREGGRLIYIGAGTSGRLGVLDASECPPTFGVPPGMVTALIAGGDKALRFPIEGAEDDADAGWHDLEEISFSRRDFLVGIAASGRTPYVLGALEYAGQLGALSASLACVSGAKISGLAAYPIEVPCGPEVIGGSTRMMSGTAQKMVLNMLSTGSMIKLGKVYRNLMVDLVATNQKLACRAINIVKQASGVDDEEARETLDRAGGSVKLAIYMLKTGTGAREGRAALDRAGGVLRDALSGGKA